MPRGKQADMTYLINPHLLKLNNKSQNRVQRDGSRWFHIAAPTV